MTSLKSEVIRVLEEAGDVGYTANAIARKAEKGVTPQEVARVCRYSDEIEKATGRKSSPYKWRLKEEEMPKGIKSRYKNIPLSKRIRGWVQLLRLYTLIAPAVAVLCGAIAALAYNGVLGTFWSHWQEILYVGTTLVVLQASGQVLNQVCDPAELDRINGKSYRPIPQGVVSQEEAFALSFLFAIFALARGFITSPVFGGFVVALLLSIIFYNAEPFRFKKKLWLNEGLLAFSRGFLPLPAVWSVFGDVTNPIPWLLGLCMFFWVFAWQASKDVNDVEGDEQFDIRTPAVKYGFEKLGRIMWIPSMASFGLLLLFVATGLLPSSLLLLTALILPTFTMHYLFSVDAPTIEELENDVVWALFYLVLAGWFVLVAISLSVC